MKRHPDLVTLSDDHHRALVLARRARVAAQAGDSAAVADVWETVARAFEADLEPHFMLEERRLLPPLNRGGGVCLVRRVEEDHAALRALAQGGLRDAGALARFAERLGTHVRFEERELFPFAERMLTAAELRSVAAARG